MSITDRITGPAIDAFQQLNGQQQYHVEEFLSANKGAELYSKRDVVNAWLTWNGIVGYTDDIISIVQHTFKE